MITKSVLSFRPWFLILLLGFTATVAVSSLAEEATTDPIVGRWRWCNNTEVFFRPDGTAGLSAEGRGGTWMCVSAKNEEPRKYVCNWGNGMWIDTLHLKKHGASLSGRNQFKNPVWGYRIAE